MTHGSLFSGIGGFDLAATWCGWKNIFQVEKDPFCQRVLRKNFPNVDRFRDIKNFDPSPYSGTVDVISGGFPCQPFSKAGAMRGADDSRYLWSAMANVCKIVGPSWVVGENVTTIRKMALDLVYASLEGLGYEVESVIIPASALGAWHRRERLWIIAYNSNARRARDNGTPTQNSDVNALDAVSAENRQPTNAYGPGVQGYPGHELQGEKRAPETRRDGAGYWSTPWVEVVAEFCRDNARLPHRMERIKSLGNSIVPQVAYEIFKGIEQLTNEYEKETNRTT